MIIITIIIIIVIIIIINGNKYIYDVGKYLINFYLMIVYITFKETFFCQNIQFL